MTDVNENTYLDVTFEPEDPDGNGYIPTTARYRLYDKTTGNEIIAWTAIATPAASMEVRIPATSNTINDTSKSFEVKVVTFEADFGTADANTEEFEYEVLNLSQIPV